MTETINQGPESSQFPPPSPDFPVFHAGYYPQGPVTAQPPVSEHYDLQGTDFGGTLPKKS